MKLKLCLFNNDLKVRLQKVTYLGCVWNYVGKSQNYNPKILTDPS